MLVLGFEFFIIKNWNFVILNIGGLLLMLLMFSSIEAVLNISDINDNFSVFEVVEFQFFVMENSDFNINIGLVSVIDKDEGKNGDFVFIFLFNS